MKKNITLLTFLYVVALALFVLSPFWPERSWWVANLFQIVPLWLFFVPLLLLFISALISRLWKVIILQVLSAILILVGIMGYRFSFKSFAPLSRSASLTVRILTMNLGNIHDVQEFVNLIKSADPDILLFQETGAFQFSILKQIFPSEKWYFANEGGLAVVSRMKIFYADTKSRKFLNGLGNIVGKFKLDDGQRTITVFNVHLETPREGVEAIMHRESGAIDRMIKVTDIQKKESELASEWVGSQDSVIVAGDFNMTTSNPIFNKYWSRYKDAFSSVGSGFGYTKHTRWHAVRIDHVLYGPDWKAVKAYIGLDIGGDHHPMVVDLEFVGEKKVVKRSEVVNLDVKGHFVLEEFETTLGRFSSRNYHEVKIDPSNTYLRGNSLRIKRLPISKEVSAVINLGSWNLADDPKVSFSYRIPADVPVSLRVRTRFDDLICLGGTESAECSGNKAKSLVALADDDDWHEIDIDVGSLIAEVLPDLKHLQEFQFYINESSDLEDKFWIDDFRVW